MKRLFRLSLLLFCCSVLLMACKRKDLENNNTELVAAESVYWGDFYGNNSSSYDLVIFDHQYRNSLSGNKNGIVIYFDLTAPVDANPTAIPVGNYKATTDRRPYTFHRGDRKKSNEESNQYVTSGSYFEIWRNDKVFDYWVITSGDLIIERNGNYTIKGIVTTGDNEARQFFYRGSIASKDVSPWPHKLAKGEIVYEGRKTGENGDRNMFTIFLGSINADFNNFGNGEDILAIELFAPITFNNTIPSGTYLVEVNTKKSMTIMDGYLYKNDNDNKLMEGGTWYYTSEKFPIKRGDMRVEVTDNFYSLDYLFYSESGMKIAGKFNGRLNTIRPSQATAGVKSKQRSSHLDNNRVNAVNEARTRVPYNSRNDNKRRATRR